MGVHTKVVLVTGCSSGIGKALCLEFHRRRFRVVATARRPETLEGLKAKGIAAYRLDVDDTKDVSRVVGTVLDMEGRIDVLVNNAGFGLIGPVIDLPETEIVNQFRTNVWAPLSLIQKVAPIMRRRGGGTIVNVGSISGVVF